MKTTLQALGISLLGMIAMALALACWSAPARADAVWNVHLQEVDSTAEYFRIDGQFTTAALPGASGTLITSFTGTFSDDLELWQSITLIPPGQSVDDFTYDDLFYGTSLASAFDNGGVLFNAGISNVNLYTDDTGLVGYDNHNGFIDFSGLEGSISLDHVTASAVPEPPVWLCMIGAFGWFVRRR